MEKTFIFLSALLASSIGHATPSEKTCVPGPTALQGSNLYFDFAAISSSKDQIAYSGHNGGLVKSGVWDYQKKDFISTPSISELAGTTIDFVPNTSLLLLENENSEINIWDTTAQKSVYRFQPDAGELIEKFDYLPAAKRLAVLTGIIDRQQIFLTVIDVASGHVLAKSSMTNKMSLSVKFNTADSIFYSVDDWNYGTPDDHTEIFSFDVTSQKSTLLYEQAGGAEWEFFTISPDRMIVTELGSSGDNSLIVFSYSQNGWSIVNKVPQRNIIASSSNFIAATNQEYDYAQDKILRVFNKDGVQLNELNVGEEIEAASLDESSSGTTLRYLTNSGSLCKVSL